MVCRNPVFFLLGVNMIVGGYPRSWKYNIGTFHSTLKVVRNLEFLTIFDTLVSDERLFVWIKIISLGIGNSNIHPVSGRYERVGLS